MILTLRVKDEIIDPFDQALRNKQFIEDRNVARSDELVPVIEKFIKDFNKKWLPK